MKAIDYDKIAELYDLYADTDYDHGFFISELKTKGEKVLELTSGTGRLSIPLIESGADLTCVDLSQGMLDKLSLKLKKKNLSARILCSDICDLEFNSEFELAIFPFQSFMELVGRDKQQLALKAIHRALTENGRFICTLHNPAIRRKFVDGTMRAVGAFPKNNGKLVVSGFEQGGNPVVTRYQFFEYYDEAGIQIWKRVLPMEFELIEKEEFEEMAGEIGFKTAALYGNYDRSEFHASTSPVMIWVLEKA